MSALVLEAVSWRPPAGPDIVRDVFLSVPAGSIVGIVGPNGAGKSSLLRCIYRVNRPHRGSIRIGHDDLWAMSARDAARRIGAVVQDTMLDDGLTVDQIVALGRLPHLGRWGRPGPRDRAIIDEALAAVELDTLRHRAIGSLSGGEKQRVAIARVLAQQPEAIVLDEPTNHLDIRHQLELMDLLRRLGRTTLVTLHDLALAARCCDRLAIMREGGIIAEGEPSAVMTPRLLEDSFGVVADVRQHVSGQIDLSFQLPRRT